MCPQYPLQCPASCEPIQTFRPPHCSDTPCGHRCLYPNGYKSSPKTSLPLDWKCRCFLSGEGCCEHIVDTRCARHSVEVVSFSLEEYGHVQKLEKDVLLVDVGGSRGRLLERFRQQRPDCLARMAVQDLPNMIESRVYDTRFFHAVIYQGSVLSHLAYPVLQ